MRSLDHYPNCKREFYANAQDAYCEECWRAWCKNDGTFEQRTKPWASLIETPSPKNNVVGWVTVRVEDTGDGLIINADDAKEWRLASDQHYEGSFLPDGRYRIAIPCRAACATTEGSDRG
ncbi:hypothetical protein DEM27_19850 [Metarhizobium album]|uniref:Uncharacterized protein n=1 Tax=Metarhizobium album TaxID=2182425 RepID=A0A2U2DM52_9HYPH|nr:hypothetical protein [Rhizobium album]PWE54371.1 hypothetical protein DEM27_19850 [Rhizobium album]